MAGELELSPVSEVLASTLIYDVTMHIASM